MRKAKGERPKRKMHRTKYRPFDPTRKWCDLASPAFGNLIAIKYLFFIVTKLRKASKARYFYTKKLVKYNFRLQNQKDTVLPQCLFAASAKKARYFCCGAYKPFDRANFRLSSRNFLPSFPPSCVGCPPCFNSGNATQLITTQVRIHPSVATPRIEP